MGLDSTQQEFLRRNFLLKPVVINLLLNGAIAWLVFGSRPVIPVFGADSLVLDTILTCFLVPFLTCLIVVPVVWQLVKQGELSGVPWRRSDRWWLAWLPGRKWARATAIGAVGTLAGSTAVLGLLYVLGVTTLSPTQLVALKAGYAALLAAWVTPLLALASLADVSETLRGATGRTPEAIPVAQLPPGSAGSHVRAMRSDMIGYVEHVARQGSLVRVPLLGPVYGYFVNDPALIREVLVRQAASFDKPFAVKYTARGLGIENIFSADGELWQTLRRVMQPAFHARQIENYAQIMIEDSAAMLAGWEEGEEVEVQTAMMDLTLGITSRALFGRDMRGDAVGAAIVRFIELFNQRIGGIPVPLWLPTATNRELKRLIAMVDEWLAPLIEERKAAREPHNDVLSMLIEAQRVDTTGTLTDRQIRVEVSNLFAAGYEVVANTLAFTLYLVSRHPDVEARIQAELDMVLGGEPVSAAALGRLTYIEMVLKESMRLVPVTTVLSRQTNSAVELGGYALPKNRLVLFSPWALQRNPAHFPDPLRFSPDRFDPETGQEIDRYAYLPFSAGPRVCLGNAFAMMQMKINLALIWQQVHLSVPPGYRLEPVFSFNTRPKGGLPMIVRRRRP